MRIADETIQQLKKQVDIVTVIDQFVSLQKRGKNYFGYCPFHDERTPSFSVSQEKQIFHCFSCGRGGDVFSFFIEKDGITYPEAIKKVADVSGSGIAIELGDIAREKTPLQQKHDTLIDMHELALHMYHHILMHTVEGQEALDYLLKRGFTKETLQTFKIGVAPNNRTVLVNLLVNKGYSQELILASGLVSGYQEQVMDRFFDRIMFPLRDEHGKCVAFSGRLYREDASKQQAKYLNSPETDIFHKNNFLFNFDLARGAIRKQDEVILCEGFMDVIAIYQAGLSHAVASMGTSFTENQIKILQKVTKKVVLAYDGDHAGVQATDRAISLLRPFSKFEIYVLPMFDNLDPDEFIQTNGATYFLNYFKHEQETAFAFYKRFYYHQFAMDTQRGVLDYVDALLKQLVYESSVTARSLYLNELAKETHISVTALEQQLQQIYAGHKKTVKKQQMAMTPLVPKAMLTPIKAEQQLPENVSKAQMQLLYRLLTDADVFVQLQNRQWQFVDVQYQTIYLFVMSMKATHGADVSVDMIVSQLPEESLKQIVSKVLMQEYDTTVRANEIDDLLSVLAHYTRQEELQQLKQALKQAVQSADVKRQEEIQQEITRLRKR